MSSLEFVGLPIPCAKCGYDLRGTSLDGSCPECGLLVAASRKGIRVDGKWLIIQSGAVLPNRCIKTNEPVDTGPVTKTLYWVHPAVWITFFFGLLILLIVYLVARKKCRITYFVSQAATNKRTKRMLIFLAVFTGGVALLFIGASQDVPALAMAGGIIFVLSLIFALIFNNQIAVGKMKKDEFWIRGCGGEFLESIRAATFVS